MTGRGLRGRQIAQLMVLATLSIDACLALLFIGAPNYMRPMISDPQSSLLNLIPACGVAWHLAGLGWMIRIYRADPEGHGSRWRFDRS